MNSHLIFVYGSLKRGQRHHVELTGARYVGPACAPGARLVEYVEGYPALVPAGDTDAGAPEGESAAVTGELYEVDGVQLGRLDAFEDCPTLYQRETIQVTVLGASGARVSTSGARVGAYAYVIEARTSALYRTIGGTWSPE